MDTTQNHDSNIEKNDDQSPVTEEPRSRADINRENSLRSTGPTSPEGRAISSQNAVKHGAYRRLTSDDLLKIDEIFRSFLVDWRPEGATEQVQVRIMAEAWHRKLQAERWFYGLMEKHYDARPMQHMDPTEPASTIEDYETWAAHKKEIQTLDRLQSMFLARYDKAARRLERMQKTRVKEEARVARSGDDRRTRVPVEKGKLHDVTFGMHAALLKIKNEASLRALQPSRKVEIPPEQENK